MRITGKGTWGPPPDRDAALALLHRAAELGVARSPIILPIPGTTSVAHLEENVVAASVQLDDGEVKAIGSTAD